ncbi:MAG: MFS transporter [Elusimicrobiota bacterium]|jgi:MFS family permease
MSDRLHARLWTLLVCQCVLVTGLALSYPFFALYLHRVRGVPMGWVGAALFAMLAATAVGQALGGELSDILGSRAVMQASVAARALAVAAMSWVMLRDFPVWALISLHVLSGFVGSFFDSAVRSYVAGACPPRQRLIANGQLRVAMNLGWAIGPGLGGMLAERSYPLLFALSAGACLACLALLRWTVPALARLRPEGGFSWRDTLSLTADRNFMRLCAYSLLIGVVMAQLVVSLSMHCVRYAGLSEAQVGWLFTINGLAVVLLQTAVAKGARGQRLTSVLAAGCLFYGAGYCGAGFASGFGFMAAAVLIVTFGEVAVSPGLHTLAANMAPEKLKGRYLGFQGLAHQSGAALGPLLGGLGLQYLSPLWSPAPWLAVAALAAVAAAGFWGLGRSLDPHQDGLYDTGLREDGMAEVLT